MTGRNTEIHVNNTGGLSVSLPVRFFPTGQSENPTPSKLFERCRLSKPKQTNFELESTQYHLIDLHATASTRKNRIKMRNPPKDHLQDEQMSEGKSFIHHIRTQSRENKGRNQPIEAGKSPCNSYQSPQMLTQNQRSNIANLRAIGLIEIERRRGNPTQSGAKQILSQISSVWRRKCSLPVGTRSKWIVCRKTMLIQPMHASK